MATRQADRATPPVSVPPRPRDAGGLIARYRRVRADTVRLAEPLSDEDLAVHGVTATDEFDDIPARTAAIANRTARTLDLGIEVTPAEVVNFDAYVGAGYGIPSPAAIEAVRLFARTEGVVLDPVYTGKAAAGLIDHVRDGRLGRGDVVVFVHTGGTPAVFTHHGLFAPGAAAR